MAITGEHIKAFQYINYENENPPFKIANYIYKKIEDAESKHVANFRSSTKVFFKHSDLVGYPNTILGVHRNAKIEKFKI